jgi:putative transposase
MFVSVLIKMTIPVNRDIASAQEICNRGQETYPGTLEKQEIVSQVVLSGNFVLDKWRNSVRNRGETSNREVRSPHGFTLRE